MVNCILFYARRLGGSIICSQCHMKEDPECEEKPPAAQPCFDPGDGIPQTCSIIRTYDGDGEVIDFRRSCSNSRKSGCIDDPRSGHRICARICSTDYCNMPSGAPALGSPFSGWWRWCPGGWNGGGGPCSLVLWSALATFAAVAAAALRG